VNAFGATMNYEVAIPKEVKKRMKSVGRIDTPQAAFRAILEVE
jgi:translation elongation factor EF-4